MPHPSTFEILLSFTEYRNSSTVRLKCIRAQLTEHSATLNEQAEIRAEHAELIAALAEIRADHGQILRSSAKLRAEQMEEIAELKAAIKEILATLKEMISCS